MNDLIASYLVLNGECSVQHLGKFYISHANAVSDVAAKKIHPPENTIGFKETEVAEEEPLINYISSLEHCTKVEALSRLNQWVDSIKDSLKKEIDFEIPFIGKLSNLDDGSIYLKPDNSLRLFTAVRAERVVHLKDSHNVVVGDKITTSAEMNRLLNGKRESGTQKYLVATLIIFFVAILVIILYYLTDGFGIHLTPGNAPSTYILK